MKRVRGDVRNMQRRCTELCTEEKGKKQVSSFDTIDPAK